MRARSVLGFLECHGQHAQAQLCVVLVRDQFQLPLRLVLPERPADDEPDPWYLLLNIYPLHISAISTAGSARTCGMAVVDPYYLARMLKFGLQQVLGGKLK